MDKQNYFIFNGVSSADMGLVIERVPNRTTARKKVETFSIPGRSGDLHQWDGSYENQQRSYRGWFQADPVPKQLHKIAAWLQDAPFSCRLEDSYDEAVYHLASYLGGDSIESITQGLARFTVTFDVAAPAYLAALEGFTITSGGLINNPTGRDALPLFELTGSVSGLLKVGDSILTILFPGTETHTIYVDCELREVWEVVDGVETFTNTAIYRNEYPKIAPGTNKIEITGGIDTVRVWPRWWKL